MEKNYEAPALELIQLAPAEQVTAELDFDALMGSAGKGVSADPDIDIDVPLS